MDKEQKTNEPIRPVGLRTFSSDIAETVKREQGSVIKVTVAEYERRQRERENVSPGSKKNIFLLAGGAVLLLAASGLMLYALLKKPKDTPPPPLAPISLISADAYQELVIDGLTAARLAEKVRRQSEPAGRVGTVENIVLTEEGKRIGAGRFLSLLDTRPPPALMRSLTGEIMIGSYKTAERGHIFLILKTGDFANAFAGLLAWEERLPEDFYELFETGEEIPNISGPAARFEDFLVKNKNARIFKYAGGSAALLYIFLDEKNILIADGQETVAEILTRGALK